MRTIKWVASVLTLLSFACNLSLQARPTGKSDGNTADYVIVGVGTAGAVLAKRLSDDKKTSVIALTSGENLNENPIIKYSKNVLVTVPTMLLDSILSLPPEIQARLNQFIQDSDAFKGLLYETGETIPQPNADLRELLWGIALPEGGASSVNAGAWCRGTNQLYAQWEAIAGPEWSVTRILQTYKQLEKYHGKTNNPFFRGYHGPIHVRQVAHPTGVSKKFSQAVINAIGVPFVLDYNDPKTPIGVSTQMQLTQKGDDGRYRVSSATAFLDHDVMRPDGIGAHGRKLRVFFNANALRTVWDGNKAIGVQYVQNGTTKTAFANKGVIVCAGLRSSPFLLQSGIGPAALLNSLNIPVVYDNPNVGQGLADQPHIITVFTSNPNDTPLNQNTIFSQISWLPAPGGDPISRQLRFTTAGVIPGITLALFDLCQPKSRGSVSISSSNPLDPPVVDEGALSDPSDLALYLTGFKTYIKSISIAVHEIDPTYNLIFPDPAILDDDALLTAFIKDQIQATQHFQSHCRMAPLDQGGVVDSRGHVYGVQNLIVADNSINPQGMDGSPMATAFLVAANIARLLGH